ncbi:MAG: hypothetical protein KGZ32_02255 [Dethiobacter sp.]|nr:hypothetical protein [Dethiobacter sp.]
MKLDEWMIMPNHMHGIIVISDDGRGGSRTAPTEKRKPVGRLIGAFKTVSNKRINELRDNPNLGKYESEKSRAATRDYRSFGEQGDQ